MWSAGRGSHCWKEWLHFVVCFLVQYASCLYITTSLLSNMCRMCASTWTTRSHLSMQWLQASRYDVGQLDHNAFSVKELPIGEHMHVALSESEGAQILGIPMTHEWCWGEIRGCRTTSKHLQVGKRKPLWAWSQYDPYLFNYAWLRRQRFCCAVIVAKHLREDLLLKAKLLCCSQAFECQCMVDCPCLRTEDRIESDTLTSIWAAK